MDIEVSTLDNLTILLAYFFIFMAICGFAWLLMWVGQQYLEWKINKTMQKNMTWKQNGRYKL